MLKPSHDAYDVVIIGAGIGGLVCGCYLAKAGMKVLICEQHHKPGGYCTSFKRGPFTFDAGPHCFGSYREGGIMRRILKELRVAENLEIVRHDPSDIVNMPNHTLEFRNNSRETLCKIQESYPKEKYIDKLFHVLQASEPESFYRLRKMTFKQLLDEYIYDEKLKALLSFPFFGICGLPSYRVSAFVGAKLYSEFLFDGGYYPVGGMQKLSDALSEKFREFGGDLKLSCFVKTIDVTNKTIDGVRTDEGHFIPTHCVVSDCDARQTFTKLLDNKIVSNVFLDKLKRMSQTLSNYILYLGVDKTLDLPINSGSFHFYFPHFDLKKIYINSRAGNIGKDGGFALKISNDQSVINAIVLAPYKSAKYWQEHKLDYMNKLIRLIERRAIPGLSSRILHKEAATPWTLHRYTLNHKGASFGWESTISQFALPAMRKPSFVNNFYLTGHWSTLGIGISGTAYIGSDTAKLIVKRSKLGTICNE